MTDASLTLTLPDAEATALLARKLAPGLAAGDVLLLEGPIGAGKSHFARALIRARLQAPDAEVPSPTFTLVQTYDDGKAEIWHADLYRLGHPDEGAELGLDQAFTTAICLIEWPERLGDLTPPDALHLRFEPLADDSRRLQITAPESWQRRLAVLSGSGESLAEDAPDSAQTQTAPSQDA
ncbi:tRNA (adenosine(37)-N6)-threonylcarbamoyltransferase complex ATPase subunit type 1 TsaE [Plastorhodobacter daqingensis]|uniref:tRNA threonylcarbamoyladenosine biosynthesis protein TsaE n=1 Tax=Plastorhodobacter daqingensis TaxID=1387281 RepID=A0ABW2UG83_9RHOB